MNKNKTAQLSNEEILGITVVNRIEMPKGFRFVDQRGNILRGTATRPYTHMAIQRVPSYTRTRVLEDDTEIRETVPSSLFWTFHSKSNPSPNYKLYTIERVVPIQEAK